MNPHTVRLENEVRLFCISMLFDYKCNNSLKRNFHINVLQFKPSRDVSGMMYVYILSERKSIVEMFLWTSICLFNFLWTLFFICLCYVPCFFLFVHWLIEKWIVHEKLLQVDFFNSVKYHALSDKLCT